LERTQPRVLRASILLAFSSRRAGMDVGEPHARMRALLTLAAEFA